MIISEGNDPRRPWHGIKNKRVALAWLYRIEHGNRYGTIEYQDKSDGDGDGDGEVVTAMVIRVAASMREAA